jgi:pantothenate synthetase
MDVENPPHGGSPESEEDGTPPDTDQYPRALPDDLPKSLDDRRSVPVFPTETEMYDGWQGSHPALLPLTGISHSRNRARENQKRNSSLIQPAD